MLLFASGITSFPQIMDTSLVLSGNYEAAPELDSNHIGTYRICGMQDAVWNLRHLASEHIPGKLSLCMGLPVMIRNNDATELCITKGQEGHILG